MMFLYIPVVKRADVENPAIVTDTMTEAILSETSQITNPSELTKTNSQRISVQVFPKFWQRTVVNYSIKLLELILVSVWHQIIGHDSLRCFLSNIVRGQHQSPNAKKTKKLCNYAKSACFQGSRCHVR